jgi:hypothetical protein
MSQSPRQDPNAGLPAQDGGSCTFSTVSPVFEEPQSQLDSRINATDPTAQAPPRLLTKHEALSAQPLPTECSLFVAQLVSTLRLRPRVPTHKGATSILTHERTTRATIPAGTPRALPPHSRRKLRSVHGHFDTVPPT